jgi:hypothetical protein
MTSFSDVIYRLGPGGAAQALLDARVAQPIVEARYLDLCAILGDLPER